MIPQNIASKYKKLVDDFTVESLGESVPELVDAVMEKLTNRASAADLLAEVEGVSEHSRIRVLFPDADLLSSIIRPSTKMRNR